MSTDINKIAMDMLAVHYLSAFVDENADGVTAYIEKEASLGSAVAKMFVPASKGVGNWGAKGGLLGAAAGGLHRAAQLHGARAGTATKKALKEAAEKAKADFAASGAKMMTPAQAAAVRRFEDAEKVRKVKGAAGAAPKFGDYAKALGADVGKSALKGAAAGGAMGAGARSAANVIKRRRIAQGVDKAAPWVAGGVGAHYLLGNR